MKIQKLLARVGLAAVLLSTLNSQLSTALAQGTAFTYQGRLDIAGVPADGTNDLTFTLYNAVSAGTTVGTSNTFNDLVITNGLFTVTLDFGAGAFNGAARWLQIAARPGVSTGAYTNLAPRQAITPSPYAVFAGGAAAAGVTGTLPASALSGAYSGSVNLSNAANSFAGNGSGLTALNASNLTSGTVADARLSTNVALRSGGNTFNGRQTFLTNVGIATAANTSVALTIKSVNTFQDFGSAIAFLKPDGSSSFDVAADVHGMDFAESGVAGGRLHLSYGGNVGIGTTTPSNRLEVAGTVKAANFVGPINGTNFTGTLPSALLNGVNGGGLTNLAAAQLTGTLPAGALSGAYSGSVNLSNAANSFAGNGSGLTALNASNLTSGTVADARLSTNVAFLKGTNVFSGSNRFAGVFIATNAGNQFGGSGAGLSNLNAGNLTGTLSAGALSGAYSGSVNLSNAANSFAGNGAGLTSLNASNLTSGTVADTRLSANVALRSGGNIFNGTQAITNGNFGIGTSNPLFPLQVRAGVNQNLIVEPGSTVGFAGAVAIRGVNDANLNNIPVAIFGTPISLLGTTVGIGTTNPVAQLDVRNPNGVGGIALGDYNGTNSRYIGIIRPGDPANITAGSGFSGVEFGGPAGNTNSGMLAFHTHNFGGGSSERMRIDKSGNVGIGTFSPSAKLDVNGNINVVAGGIISSFGTLHIQSQAGQPLYLNPFGSGPVLIGGGTSNQNLTVTGEIFTQAINLTSDRNAKEEFKPVNARAVLDKVARLPISEWQYKTQGDARHIGPMAQDFREAFALGRDEKHIASVDADGVALAAIQGLNEKLEEKSAEVDALRQSVAELKELVKQLTHPAGR